MFINGLNSFALLRRSSTAKLRQVPKDALVMMRSAAETSRWNYLNKVHLLEAELASFENRHEQAKWSYAAAILASRSSRFKHEVGLSCELAGHHYRRVGDVQRAACLFNHARQCYSEWGSNMKMKTIDRQLSKMRSSGLSG